MEVMFVLTQESAGRRVRRPASREFRNTSIPVHLLR
jgi:hypothetical protein